MIGYKWLFFVRKHFFLLVRVFGGRGVLHMSFIVGGGGIVVGRWKMSCWGWDDLGGGGSVLVLFFIYLGGVGGRG